MENLLQDFNNYAIHHLGVSSMQLYYWNKLQENIYSNKMLATPASGSMTPYIIEEMEKRGVQMDIFSRLMMDRIIWLGGVVNDNMSSVVVSQLMWMNQQDPKSDITIYVDSPGGSVKSGLSIVDTIDYIEPDVATVNMGMAASMGSILLGCGTKGKRASLKHSRVMLHQVSAGAQGNVQDMEITLRESVKYNEELFELLGSYTDKNPKDVMKDATRDFWLDAPEALEYGIIDEIIGKK